MEYQRCKHAHQTGVPLQFIFLDHLGLPRTALDLIQKYIPGKCRVPPMIEIAEFLDVKKDDLERFIDQYKKGLIQGQQSCLVDGDLNLVPDIINVEIKSIVYAILLLEPLEGIFLRETFLPETSFMLYQDRVRLGPKYDGKKDSPLIKKFRSNPNTLFIYIRSSGKKLLLENKGYIVYATFIGYEDDADREQKLKSIISSDNIVGISKRHTEATFSPVREIPPTDKPIVLDLLTSRIHTFNFFYTNEVERIPTHNQRLIIWVESARKMLTVNVQRGKLEFNTNDLSPYMRYHHIEYTQKILSILLADYPTDQQEIIGYYNGHHIPLQSSSSVSSKPQELHPDIPKNYKTLCPKQKQTDVITDISKLEKAMDQHGIDRSLIAYYKLVYGAKGTPQTYACLTNKDAADLGYHFPGLKETPRGSGVIVPCCYKQNQYLKGSSLLHKMLIGSSSTEKGSVNLNVDKILNRGSTGYIPPYLLHLVSTTSRRLGVGNLDQLLEHLFTIRPSYGTFRNHENPVLSTQAKKILQEISIDNFEKYFYLVCYALNKELVLFSKDYKYDTVFLKLIKIHSESRYQTKHLVIKQQKDKKDATFEIIVDQDSSEITTNTLLEYLKYWKNAIRRERREIDL